MKIEELNAYAIGFNPDLILCSGWMDKDYVAICKTHHKSIPTVLTMDNHWNGGIKQHVARFLSPFTLKKAFSHVFVPGNIQSKYAQKLGFSKDQILAGFYSADTQKFSRYYQDIDHSERIKSKRFIYLGRYTEHKGIFDLWRAFQRSDAHSLGWELWCVGTGDAFDQRPEMEGIKHFGFVQPNELLPILKETSVYILPSHFEPWGVSVHEMAATGFPMLLSDKIGSREMFMKANENGYLFNSADVASLTEKMNQFMKLSEAELEKMGELSRALSKQNSPNQWAEKVMNIK
ncbi:MAG: hypothetical protein Salg2KO_14560 [Salibacteraceae bacterium]